MKCWNSTFNAQGSKSNDSTCTNRNNENICSNNGGLQEKGKIGWNSLYHKIW
jgi:hypothetical protein